MNTMKKLWIALFCMASACGTPSGFSDAEHQTIVSQNGQIMRLSTIADRTDSLLLRQRALPLGKEELASPDFQLLKQGMLATVCDTTNTGVGIAAPQVGISRRLIAVQRFDKANEPFEFYVNPEILFFSESKSMGHEGCLSVPDISGQVLRSDEIVLRYADETTLEPLTDTVKGFTAVIFQHEVDHLDGVLFIDKMESSAASE